MGNSGTAEEVVDRVIERIRLSGVEQAETTSNGQSRVRNQIAWARFYLAKAGLIDAERRGVWSLTNTGRKKSLDQDSVPALFREVRPQFRRAHTSAASTVSSEAHEEAGASAIDDDSYAAELLAILRSLPAGGFERIFQRLSRASGFEKVEVTGRSGDGLDLPLVERIKVNVHVIGTKRHLLRIGTDSRADHGAFHSSAVPTPDALDLHVVTGQQIGDLNVATQNAGLVAIRVPRTY